MTYTYEINIRKALLAEASLIRQLALAIWPKSFNEILSEEQIEYMLEMMYSKPALQKDMQQGVEFYIVKVENEDCGYAAIEQLTETTYKLHKIYLSQKLHGKGLGKELLKRIEGIVKNHNATILKLNVNRNNKAIDFYKSQGYQIIKSEDIDIGNGYLMNDYVMEKHL